MKCRERKFLSRKSKQGTAMGLAAHRIHSMFNKEVQKEKVIKLNLLTTPKLMCDAHNNETENLFVGVPSCFHVNKSRLLSTQ